MPNNRLVELAEIMMGTGRTGIGDWQLQQAKRALAAGYVLIPREGPSHEALCLTIGRSTGAEEAFALDAGKQVLREILSFLEKDEHYSPRLKRGDR